MYVRNPEEMQSLECRESGVKRENRHTHRERKAFNSRKL